MKETILRARVQILSKSILLLLRSVSTGFLFRIVFGEPEREVGRDAKRDAERDVGRDAFFE